jgi:phage terminase large subunit-like protein
VIALEVLKAEQMSGFNQNYLGIPDMGCQKFVRAEDILPMKIDGKKVPRKELDYIVIGIDPAFSTKTATDAIGIVVTGYHTVQKEDGKTRKNKYTLRAKALEGEDKRQTNFVAEAKAMYQNYHVSRIIIEGNNGGSILAEQLQAEGLAVDVVNASKDKVTRFKEHERDLQNGRIFFVEGETE